MRFVLRSVLISYVAVKASELLVNGMNFGADYNRNLFLVILAVTVLNIFMIPLFKILSLPHFGVGFIFLNLVLTLVIMYVLTMFLPDFSIEETTLSELSIFNFVLPSKHLTVFWSVLYTGLCISLVYHFIEWLFEKR